MKFQCRLNTKVREAKLQVMPRVCFGLKLCFKIYLKCAQLFELKAQGKSPEKSSCSFGFCPNEGQDLPKFFVHFSLVHFWSIKGVYFLQNANNFNFKLFLRLICISYYDVYIVSLVLKIDRPNLKSSILRLVYRRSTCNFIGAV